MTVVPVHDGPRFKPMPTNAWLGSVINLCLCRRGEHQNQANSQGGHEDGGGQEQGQLAQELDHLIEFTQVETVVSS